MSNISQALATTEPELQLHQGHNVTTNPEVNDYQASLRKKAFSSLVFADTIASYYLYPPHTCQQYWLSLATSLPKVIANA